ncbi:MAG: FAD:protein FMN transferase [Clostridiales bacterium]|nr:FAD:protein FMN transferase [Clostridiales bacterium]
MKKWVFVKIISILCLFMLIFTGCASKESFSGTVTGMGTVISYKIYGKNPDVVYTQISHMFDEIENACSLTKEGSKINLLNETGTTDNKYITEQVEKITPLLEKSEGKFDYTVGALTTLWNIGFLNAKKPEHNEIEDAVKFVDGSKTMLKDGTLTLLKGQKVDLGATAKGYALDKAKEILDLNKVQGAVITVGGSVLFYGQNPSKKDWVCAVKDPFNTNKYLGTFNIKEGFVSTSGSYERFFEENGTKYHHIIDATTGYPVNTDLVSVTVVCPDGLMSDALSTVCFMVGSEKSKGILTEYNAQGIFVTKNGEITVVGDIDFEKTVN